ncbi:TorD/DmsD family molecular chaperone [Azospirillum isscasi]|uniref:Molecular chaperone TorD family protein n=1 Tax=Azospirillum isscasi TaxID=3053926 RepID=A0ABU0WMZ2_9PROT|nr:molecular chaperone TorD family protein [Azospirillum isscasi]MDQ2105600.1 molecular chaperone TorD family protein [Azospirillum isscasi]
MAASASIDDADRLRAQAYGLLAHLLARPPSRALLGTVGALAGDGSPLGRAITALAARARSLAGDPDGEHRAGREYHDLFIGVTRGELVPFASYYRTGFLIDRPLARLREDMQELGVERAPGVSEPEDHIAAIADIMGGLAAGTIGTADLPHQKRFFERHLAPWAPRFFRDLEEAAAADLYRPVGTVGRLFLDIETNAFAMIAHAHDGAVRGQDKREGIIHAP